MNMESVDRSPLTVGIAGTGWMGTALMTRLVERDDVRVAAVCGRDAERGRQAIEQAGAHDARWTDDYDSIVSDDTIDAVFVCTPNAMHGPQSIAALEAGKHVFCEKPCATSFAEFARQIELDRDRPDLVTMVDYILRFDPMEQRLRSMVADGVFGELKQVQVNYRHPINIAGAKAWKLDRSIMGDAIGMGINHAISVIVWLLAEQGASPRRVYATSAEAKVRPFEADPTWNIQIEFDNGAAAFCFGDIDDANGYDAYHGLHGSGGGFVFDSLLDPPAKVRYWSNEHTGRRWVYPLDRKRCESEGVNELVWPERLTTPDSGDVINHQTSETVAHFVEHARAGRPSPLGFEASAVIADIGWAAQMSAAMARPIDLPLDRAAAASFFAEQGSPA